MNYHITPQYQGKAKQKTYASPIEAQALAKALQKAYNEACGEGVYVVYIAPEDMKDFQLEKISIDTLEKPSLIKS